MDKLILILAILMSFIMFGGHTLDALPVRSLG